MESLSKDLDDLVSLYEIVSEQMNPFVGLSKVTKKRLDALENITTEVDALKNKMGDIETIFEKGGVSLTSTPKDTTTQQKDQKNEASPLPPEAPAIPPPEVTTTPPQPPATPSQPAASLPTVVLPPAFTVTAQPTTTGFSDTEVDVTLSKAIESFFIEQKIDSIMNEFFQGLK